MLYKGSIPIIEKYQAFHLTSKLQKLFRVQIGSVFIILENLLKNHNKN